MTDNEIKGASASASSPPEDLAAALLYENYYWTPGNFTFSIPKATSSWPGYAAGEEPFDINFGVLNPVQADQFRVAIGLWDDLIAPDFTERVEPGETGDIRVGFSDIGDWWGWAYVPQQPPFAPSPISGDVWISYRHKDTVLEIGSYDFQALLHEIGHSVGLKHPFDDSPVLPTEYDNTRYTVMSYVTDTEVYRFITRGEDGNPEQALSSYVSATTPMLLDIQAIQERYGADPDTNKGNTTYKWDEDQPIFMAIYDAAGIDTFDLSDNTRGSTVNLEDGTFSSIAEYSVAEQIASYDAIYNDYYDEWITDWIDRPDTYTWSDNVAIAFGTTIENVIGSPDEDVIAGNAVANSLFGGGGNDSLSGLGGSDSLDGGAGADTMVGGTGNDTYGVERAGDRVVEAASGGTDLVRSSIAYTLGSNVENLALLGSSNLKGSGNSLGNKIIGNSGDNILNGAAGNDSLVGGSGDDSLVGSSGSDTLVGGSGNDTYGVGGSGDKVVESASEGVDRVRSSVSYALSSNVENLDLLGSSDLSGTGNSLANRITGNSGDNILNGASGDDSLGGGSGNDSLYGSSGSDSMVGGNGNDTYGVGSSGDKVVESASGGVDLVRSSVSYTLNSNVENLELSGSSDLDGTGNSLDNKIIGNSRDNILNGGSGDDSLAGGSGNDSLYGSSGSDTMVGGAGNDTYGVGSSGDKVMESASGGVDLVRSSVSYTLGSNVENLELSGSSDLNGTGNSLNNKIIGNSRDNILHGGTGNDSLRGGDGNDSLYGSSGSDTMVGGTGNDTYGVGGASDVVVEASSQGTDLVRSTVSYRLGTNLENLELLGSSALEGTGNGVGNRLIGNSGSNVLNGLSGNDSLVGGGGNDSLYGSSGSDTLVGGSGNDTYGVDSTTDKVVEAASEGTDLVRSSVAYTLGSNVENLELLGSATMRGSGNTLGNRIIGNSGRNVLNGMSGNDSLIGGAGNDSVYGSFGNDTLIGVNASTFGVGEIDTLTGGQDYDRFVLGNSSGRFYNDGSSSTVGTSDYALITDFTVGVDILQLDGAAGSYYLGSSPVNGVTGKGLFYDNGTTDELVAIIRSGNSTTLTTANTVNTAAFV